MMGYDSLDNMMRSTWAMVQHHKWDYEAIENMLAWERQVNVSLTAMYLKEEKDRIQLQQQTRTR